MPDRLSVGAQADSAHEYLLKQYLLTAKTDKTSLEMCTQSLELRCNGVLLFFRPSRHDSHHY